MKALLHCVAAALMFAAIPALLLAQWPAYPTPNVPKTADGKPNLEGPTPRTADGHPDFNGIWEFVDAFRGTRRAGAPGTIAGSGPAPAPPAATSNGAASAPPATTAPATPPAPPTGPPPGPPRAGGTGLGPRPFGPNQFFDIGSTLKDGLPFTPWAKALRKERTDNNNKDNPDAHCLPMGFMQFHTHPQPRKIIQTPTLMVIIYEANYGLRQIFMDGRPLPSDDPDPWWYGYSIGHWDGDTLVVETTGFRDDMWLDVEGSPLTSSGKVTERFRRPDFGHMTIDITVEDPKAYTHPWTIRISDRIMLNTELIEFICNENERSDAHLVGK
ncbi:MAG: hypothetical protein ACLPWF_10290 [Bryobacteraceae bacterium]